MSAHPLDTLAIAGKLKAAGFSDAQAETMTFVLRDAREADASNLTTKADLEQVRIALKTDIDALRSSSKTDMDALRVELKTDINTLRVELKTDIDTLRVELKSDIRALELRLEARIEAGKSETIKWVVSAIGFQTIVLVGAVVALSRLFQS